MGKSYTVCAAREDALLARAHSGCAESRATLLEQYRPMCMKLAGANLVIDLELDERFVIALQLADRAIMSYRHGHNASLKTWIWSSVRRGLIEEVRNQRGQLMREKRSGRNGCDLVRFTELVEHYTSDDCEMEDAGAYAAIHNALSPVGQRYLEHLASGKSPQRFARLAGLDRSAFQALQQEVQQVALFHLAPVLVERSWASLAEAV